MKEVAKNLVIAKKMFKKHFPKAEEYTAEVLLWEDNDFEIKVVSGYLKGEFHYKDSVLYHWKNNTFCKQTHREKQSQSEYLIKYEMLNEENAILEKTGEE